MPSHTSTKPTLSISDSNGMKVPPCKTEILFRVWTHRAESKKLPSHDANARRQGAVAFIEDILASRKGVLVATDDNLFVSILESPSEALVVSRQVQLGMRGFLDKSGNQPVAISISIDADTQNTKVAETRNEGTSENNLSNPSATKIEASHDLLSLIRMSKPDQILLTHDLFQQISPFKGLPLKPFQGRFGVFEYLWTSEEKLLELQSQQGRFVDSMEEPNLETETPELAGVETQIPSEENVRIQLSPAAFSAETSNWKRSLRSPWSIAAISTLLLAIIVAGGVMLRVKKPGAQSPDRATNQAAGSTRQVSPAAAPGSQSSAIKAESKSFAVPKTPSAAPKQKSDSARAKNKAVPDTAPSPTPCKLSGNPKSYLPVAERYRENGKYSDAERLFRGVLDCDPKNPEATQGLSRTLAAEQENRR
jgi:hypothetical protein